VGPDRAASISAPPTDNLLVRKAIQAALDMDEIMDAATDGNTSSMSVSSIRTSRAYTDAGKETYNIKDRPRRRRIWGRPGTKASRSCCSPQGLHFDVQRRPGDGGAIEGGGNEGRLKVWIGPLRRHHDQASRVGTSSLPDTVRSRRSARWRTMQFFRRRMPTTSPPMARTIRT